ncbi:uncharacterized protein LOC108629602 [Ceratina calcarata]|uniref:Uncharacterized protein LOC108629602 n=1 Tax=Ceratina calcarata TaxID=156304 RepID=A0AAJ7S991_9HYME|nr:uncharacterized protein LOC108629602 [Ceratina calcarata]
MSARSQRGVNDVAATKRFRSPNNRTPKQHITYDYDAAISQPDVPNLLNCKKIGRGTMVSAPIKKRAVKPRLKGQITSSKSFQKKSQELRARQKNAKELLSVSKNASHEKKTNAPKGILEEEKQVAVKENVTSNGDVDNSSNRLGVCFRFLLLLSFIFRFLFFPKNLIMNDETILSKDITEETITTDNQDRVAQEKIKDDDCESITKSPVPVKGSKIPRARINVFPVHTFQEFHPV